MILTCETTNCQNAEIPIELETDAQNYACGACFEPITNATVKPDARTDEK
jgi:hypothetical protein